MAKVYSVKSLVFVGLVLLAGSAYAFGLKPAADDYSRNLNYTPVFTKGGGPTKENVNVNKPKIGKCGLPNKSDKYEVSTCDKEQIKPQLETFVSNYVEALMMMAEQFSAVMFQQMEILGTFFDAKEQLEVQQDIEILKAQAHKDYHPGGCYDTESPDCIAQMCVFGTGVRSLAHVEEHGRYNRSALAAILHEQYRDTKDTSTSKGYAMDIASRLKKFKKTYCDPADNNNGLWELCYGKDYDANNPPSLPDDVKIERFNKDIDYNRTLYGPHTLYIDYTDGKPFYTLERAREPQEVYVEEDLVALARNLYWMRAISPADEDEPHILALQDARAMMARASVAHNSFINIVGMKTPPPKKDSQEDAQKTGGAHLKAIMLDFGLDKKDIHEIYGENPSYYAQMEILTKKIYQHPDFYTNLYDKPANIDRINATLEAIQLMHGRDRYNSLLRREMLLAMLVEDAMGTGQDRLMARIQGLISSN